MRVDVTWRFRELAPVRPCAATKQYSIFSIESIDLLNNLLELEKLLNRVKPQYLRPKCFIRIKGSQMSEEDKDELDADLVELLKICSNRIAILKSTEETQPIMSSVEKYQKGVIAYLLERLKCIADRAKQMQKKRYQQPLLLSSRLLPERDRQDLDALEQNIVQMSKEEATKKQAVATFLKPAEIPSRSSLKSPGMSISSPRASCAPPMAASPGKPKQTNKQSPSKARKPVSKSQQGLAFDFKIEKLELTEEDDRRFRVENLMLHRHIQENVEDAKKMESKMAEISTLMGQFADKIMEQQTDIELIQHHALETKSNVAQSNRILEQTQKVGKGYGFIIFCFYAVFSIVLHMLHYFNS